MYVLVEYIDNLVNKNHEQDNGNQASNEAATVCNYDNNYYGDQMCIPSNSNQPR